MADDKVPLRPVVQIPSKDAVSLNDFRALSLQAAIDCRHNVTPTELKYFQKMDVSHLPAVVEDESGLSTHCSKSDTFAVPVHSLDAFVADLGLYCGGILDAALEALA